ncbi:MAG: hypothetical protein LKE41_14015 [Prevotella sp.]|nr:hypothetical protein [Prevotella sp.]MCI2103154.1 hypothetical protein [Prevotella sp.]
MNLKAPDTCCVRGFDVSNTIIILLEMTVAPSYWWYDQRDMPFLDYSSEIKIKQVLEDLILNQIVYFSRFAVSFDKLRCTSEIKIKQVLEDLIINQIVYFSRFAVSFDKLRCTSEIKIKQVLFCISLGLQYLCKETLNEER